MQNMKLSRQKIKNPKATKKILVTQNDQTSTAF